jgi:hypothetical protein
VIESEVSEGTLFEVVWCKLSKWATFAEVGKIGNMKKLEDRKRRGRGWQTPSAMYSVAVAAAVAVGSAASVPEALVQLSEHLLPGLVDVYEWGREHSQGESVGRLERLRASRRESIVLAS